MHTHTPPPPPPPHANKLKTLKTWVTHKEHILSKPTPEKQEIGNFLGKYNADPRKQGKLTQTNHCRRNK